MMNWRDRGPVTDEDLVAYLDGQLDGEEIEYLEREVRGDRALEARLDLLRRGERPFAEAYELLLDEAPEPRLEKILDRAINPPPPPPPPPVEDPETDPAIAATAAIRPGSGRSWRLLAAAVVLLAVFAGGMFASRVIPVPDNLARIAGLAGQQKGWRAAVAEYQALFVKATLEQADLDPAAQAAGLRAALGHVGLDLSVEKVSVAPLNFKRAEVLAFRGKPLVQMAYLMNGEKPVSFCIIKSAKPAHGVMAETRLGLNIAHWQSGEYGYMVIGDVPEEDLGEIARQLAKRLS